MRNLVKEAIEADAKIDRTGDVYPVEDVREWIARLARGVRTGDFLRRDWLHRPVPLTFKPRRSKL